MDTRTLIDIANTRMEAEGDNPTGKRFLYEVIQALEELERYRTGENPALTGTSSYAHPANPCYTPLGES